jgi:hypothetical protein
VVVVFEPLLHLLKSDDPCVRSVNRPKSLSHRFEIDVHVARNVVNYELQSFQLYLLWSSEVLYFLHYRLADLDRLVELLNLKPWVS